MPFKISYGAWIKETSGERTVIVSMSEDDLVRELKLLLMEDPDVDRAFKNLKQKIIDRIRSM